jgi:hypothetical protein
MRQSGGGLARGMREVRERSGEELSVLFGWAVQLPDDFGAPKRRRLFFPLTGVLAVPFPGALGRPGLSRDLA